MQNHTHFILIMFDLSFTSQCAIAKSMRSQAKIAPARCETMYFGRVNFFDRLASVNFTSEVECVSHKVIARVLGFENKRARLFASFAG